MHFGFMNVLMSDYATIKHKSH